MARLGRRTASALIAAGLLTGCSTLRVTAPVSSLPPDRAEALSVLLHDFVDDQGRVDFRRLASGPAPLETVVAGVANTAPFHAPGAFPMLQDQLAFHINAYNALAMYDVIRSGIPTRLSLLDRVDFFKLTRFVIGGRATSLYDYESDVIRPLGDERVHFALNCMAVSCPRLPRVPFEASRIDAQLDSAARLFFSEPRNLQVDPERHLVLVSSILNFYTGDFLKKAPSLIAYVNRYYRPLIPDEYNVQFIPYDWTINIQPGTSQPANIQPGNGQPGSS